METKIKQFNSQVLMQTTPRKFHYKGTERHFQNTHKRHEESTRSLYRGGGGWGWEFCFRKTNRVQERTNMMKTNKQMFYNFYNYNFFLLKK